MSKSSSIYIILIFIFLFLILLLGTAFTVLGFYIYDNYTIMPNITIEGIDVSGLTYNEALDKLNVFENEERKKNASVTVRMPDGSELRVTGEDVKLDTDIRFVINEALNYKRGLGFFADTILYINRYMSNVINFETVLDLDTGFINYNAGQFAQQYNYEHGALRPVIYKDTIEVTIGTGHTVACANDISEIIHDGLHKSLERGVPVEVEYMPPVFQEFRLAAELEKLWQKTRVLPTPAMYDRETRTISQDIHGVTFDFVEAMELLRDADVGQTVIINMVDVVPDMTKEYMESFLFVDIIGEETTRVAGTADRLHNITLASGAIHGYVVEPGEEFSFNRAVGPRTKERDFRMATVIIAGVFTQGIGGGICQVSSTLYSAIMDTDLLITERRPHRLPITYLPSGRDATVAWGAIDFRFVNNTDRPVRIDFELENRRLTARVEGTLPDGWEPSIRGRIETETEEMYG